MNFLKNFLLVFIFFCSFIQKVDAATRGGCIPGTYLIQEGNGALSLWTFFKDGAIQSASSAQGSFNFSDAQGAWKQKNSRKATTVMIDFTYGGNTTPAAIARVEAEFTFSKKCDTVEGTFELRFFDPQSEDPLHPETDSGDPISDTFTGRRIIAK